MSYWLLCLCFLQLICSQASAQTDPTKGFTEQPLDQSNFEIQKPYDKSVDQRYSFVDGVHKLWVYSTDKPHTPTSNTEPRTEIRIRVFGASTQASTLQVRVYNGQLMYYRSVVLDSNIYDRWFKLNVIHDVEASKVQIYVDGVLKYAASGHGGDSHYFKCGVYAQNNDSNYMESRWKNIKILQK
ncbi:Alginate lyase 2 [Dillenia turbinata]|uniref:Alginate lyase 2 n=1 Tax=Dillenia turbinata TaxID=194707 RepID=A0AAN8V0Z1_9MAGN